MFIIVLLADNVRCPTENSSHEAPLMGSSGLPCGNLCTVPFPGSVKFFPAGLNMLPELVFWKDVLSAWSP